jgi:hypothetical protein
LGAILALGTLLLTQTALGDGRGALGVSGVRPQAPAISAPRGASISGLTIDEAPVAGSGPAYVHPGELGLSGALPSVNPGCLKAGAETIYDGGWVNACR